MVNFMGDIEKTKENSLTKLNTVLKAAPKLAKGVATDLVDTIVYQVQMRLDQGPMQPFHTTHVCWQSVIAQRTAIQCQQLFTVCLSPLCLHTRSALQCIIMYYQPLQPCRTGCCTVLPAS